MSEPNAQSQAQSKPEAALLRRPAPLPAAVADHTGVVLYKVAHFVQDHLDRALQPQGLKTRHHAVLAVLAHMRPMSQQALVEKLGIDRAMMVGIVDDLERLALVERRRNARDRRVYDITLTPAGRAQVAEADAALDAMERAVFAPLTATEREQLHTLLTRLLAAPEEVSPE